MLLLKKRKEYEKDFSQHADVLAKLVGLRPEEMPEKITLDEKI